MPGSTQGEEWVAGKACSPDGRFAVAAASDLGFSESGISSRGSCGWSILTCLMNAVDGEKNIEAMSRISNSLPILERIRDLTNLRVVPDDASDTGYRVEVGPCPGWATLPKWRPEEISSGRACASGNVLDTVLPFIGSAGVRDEDQKPH